jgi:hypothetical protein
MIDKRNYSQARIEVRMGKEIGVKRGDDWREKGQARTPMAREREAEKGERRNEERGGMKDRNGVSKSCLHLRGEGNGKINENVAAKKVRFSNVETNVGGKNLVAKELLHKIREEYQHLPDIFQRKQLYFKLDEKFGYEGWNQQYMKFFLSPSEKWGVRRRLSPFVRKQSLTKVALGRDLSNNNRLLL